MIPFQKVQTSDRDAYISVVRDYIPRSCAYSFANIYMWGLQKIAFMHGCVLFFSHFYGKSVYPYPVGHGDRKAAVEDILRDAAERGIPCRLVSMTAADCEELETWFPGRFRIRPNRDSFDYVYDISELATLAGRKFQKKRNHANRFRAEHPEYQVIPLDATNKVGAQRMIQQWYKQKKLMDPDGDFLSEQVALDRAFRHFDELHLEGAVLMENREILAVTMASPLGEEIYDVHFEKAMAQTEGAYAVINQDFAAMLRARHPNLKFLNREEDMGLEGLRKAKLSYNPHHMEEKYWAALASEIEADDE